LIPVTPAFGTRVRAVCPAMLMIRPVPLSLISGSGTAATRWKPASFASR
jgi:hypothetical protein